MATAFELEAYKLLIDDIASAEETDEDTFVLKFKEGEGLIASNAEINASKAFRLRMVWVQGNIVSSEGKFIIQDGSGEAVLEDFDSVPGADPEIIQPGTYLGVLGQVLRVRPTVHIKPIKVMHGNTWRTKRNNTSSWKEEVRDLKLFLLNATQPIL